MAGGQRRGTCGRRAGYVGARAKHVYGKGEAHVGEKIRARVAGGQGRGTYWTSAGRGVARGGAREHVLPP